ncbi:MAG: AMP-binding protein, partial [Acidobacteria bacterium]|nr:AMP-binding protein [Acidobacteriota bacterium]
MNIEFPERFNMAEYFLYHNVTEGREGKTCLYFEDETYTYGEAVRRSNRLGNALRELGVRQEDRVLIVLPDIPEFAWTWFGAARIGAVITMVNPLLPAADYKYYLEYTRAPVAVIHESLLDNFAEAAQSAGHLRKVLVVGSERGEQGDFLSFEKTLSAMPDELTPADTHRDDIAIWLF